MTKLTKVKTLLLLPLLALPVAAQAQSSALEDFETAIAAEASTMVSTIGVVAASALGIFALLYGIRLAIRAFKTVK